MTAQDINNRYYYEYSRDWAVLFGCDACKKAYELADANSQEGFKAAFDDAFAYTDFYTLQATLTVANDQIYEKSINGFCLEDHATGSKSCFAMVHKHNDFKTFDF